ncbi:MAG: hypothetical protein H6673_08985 [Anaerolineales bacterium]|nr:hypothetical protein [Anaerolineales bacterium]
MNIQQLDNDSPIQIEPEQLIEIDPYTLQFGKLNGRFSIINFDLMHMEWTIITDRIGAYHVYALYKDGLVQAIGDDLAELAQHSTKRLDYQALATFLTFGFFLDDRTYFEDIRILLPASIYRFSTEGILLEHRKYWEWHHTVDETRTYEQTLEEYDVLFRQAVQRCVRNGKVLLPLSGGLDSRSLAAVLPYDADVETYSYGYTDDSIEIRIAQQIAKTRNLSFTAHTIRPYLFDRLPAIVKALHGSQDVTQARQASISEWLSQHGDAVITGLWGDVWCDQMGAADGLAPDTSVTQQTVKKLKKRGYEWLLSHLLSDGTSRVTLDYLVSLVETGIQQFQHIEDIDFRIKAYKTSRWAFRWSNASLRAFELGATPRIPYYDIDLIDFFCTVPTDFVRDRRLQIDHLKRYAPDLARIEWQASHTNLYQIAHSRWLSLPKRAIRKIQRTITRKSPIQRNWEVQLLGKESRPQLEQWLLAPNLHISNLFNIADLSSLIDDFYIAPRAEGGYTVSMLLTISAWLESVL